MLIFFCFVSRHSGERVATGLSYLCKRNHGGAARRQSRGSTRQSRSSKFNAAKPRFKVQRFSDLKVQSDPKVDDNGPLAQFKVQRSRSERPEDR